MRLTRHQAVMMHKALENLSLGYLSEEMIEVVIGNCNALGEVASELKTLNRELHDRMYAGHSDADVNGMFALIMSGKMAEAKEKYPELWPLFEKHNRLSKKLSAKEVEIEIERVDADAFIKGILKGRKDITIAEIKEVLHPMFNEKEQVCSLSELDNLMKE